MTPCLSKVEGECAPDEEVSAFYEANPKLQFMFLDNYYDFDDYKILFGSFINNVNYVSVDPAYLSSVNFFVRKMFLEAEPFLDGSKNKNDVFTSATISKSTTDYLPY